MCARDGGLPDLECIDLLLKVFDLLNQPSNGFLFGGPGNLREGRCACNEDRDCDLPNSIHKDGISLGNLSAEPGGEIPLVIKRQLRE